MKKHEVKLYTIFRLNVDVQLLRRVINLQTNHF